MSIDDASEAFYHATGLSLDECMEIAELVESDIGSMINHDDVMQVMLTCYNDTHVRPIALKRFRQ